jgi:uncharacterized protein YndB with AHSA1/START domain
VFAQLADSAIERFDRAVRARQHHTSLHYHEHVGRDRVEVRPLGHAVRYLIETLANHANPILKILSDQLVRGLIFGIDLEREAADRTAVAEIRLKDALAIPGKDCKDARDGFVSGLESGLGNVRTEAANVPVEDFAEQRFLAFEEVVEAAGVDVGMREKIGHAGAGEAAVPEKKDGGIDKAVAGGGGGLVHKNRLQNRGYLDLLERSTNSLQEGSMKMLRPVVHLAVIFTIVVLFLASDTMRFTVAAAVPNTPAAPPSAGEKELVIEVTVPASRAEVWKAFTTSDGLSTWLTPGATVDLRPGGEWMARFPGGSTGGGTIVSFVPEKQLVLSALAPEKFPTVRATRTAAKFEFESRGDNETAVKLTQTGWKDGKEWDEAYEHLTAGNAELMATLHRRFVSGPIDWKKEWGG